MHWTDRFEQELTGAARARRNGNEGQARVCARRAAGIVGAEYYSRRGLAPPTASAMSVLQQLRGDEAVPAAALPSLEHLLLQVDAEFKLPDGVDLIAEARRLRETLLPEG